MNIMRVTGKVAAFSAAILLCGFGVRADGKANYVLIWISSHLQTVSYTVTTPLATYQENESARMEFDGCYATILEVVRTPKGNIQTAVSFDLKNIQQDRIRFRPETGSGDTHVTPYYLVQLPFVRSAISVTTFSASGQPQTSTDASRSVSIVFQDLDTANRQASAWRDAALACGAR
ncbi:MAG TPA: hypothetical protein VK709_19760 [Candidatus Saccharimonadales bacterium]|jgi:hypothetical protein|nr:hypothetical protein [Candidatus Saccharimonadales bacterium]